MNPLIILGGLTLVGVGVAVAMSDSDGSSSASEAPRGLPSPKVLGQTYTYLLVAEGKSIGSGIERNGQPLPIGPDLAAGANAILGAARTRQSELPPKHRGNVFAKGDPYATELYPFPSCGNPTGQWQCPMGWVDQYGRWQEGTIGGGSTFGGGMAKIAGIIGMVATPFVVVAAPAVAPYYLAALQGLKSIGEGQSLTDTAIALAKSQVPPEYQVAFDIGVGLAQGKDVSTSAVESYLAANPEASQWVQLGATAAG